jgi:hypothetical protein
MNPATAHPGVDSDPLRGGGFSSVLTGTRRP